MASPKGFIIYRIYYANTIVYVGRTKQPLQSRMHGHMFNAPMHRSIDIHNVSKIEYTMLKTEADMNLYEIYYINLWKPALNVDDKAKDKLTIQLPDLEWKEFVPVNWDKWKEQLKPNDMYGWHKAHNNRVMKKAQKELWKNENE